MALSPVFQISVTLQVKLTGTHLSQQVYGLLTYIQATQSQTLLEQSTTAKNKAKDKKKVPKGLNLPGKVIGSAPCTIKAAWIHQAIVCGFTFVSYYLTTTELVRNVTTVH